MMRLSFLVILYHNVEIRLLFQVSTKEIAFQQFSFKPRFFFNRPMFWLTFTMVVHLLHVVLKSKEKQRHSSKSKLFSSRYDQRNCEEINKILTLFIFTFLYKLGLFTTVFYIMNIFLLSFTF